MKILLILAHSKKSSYPLYQFSSSVIQPSLTLAQLAAVTPNEHSVELIDNRINNINFNWVGDIVGISSLTYAINYAYEIADKFREKGISVVLGGYHASALPDEAKQHADAVVIGEAETSWPQLLKDFEKDKLKSFYHSGPVNAKLIPNANRTLQNGISFVSRVQATRGCPNRCEFCSVGNVETNIFRKRPIENVINEIKSLKSPSFSFDDSSLTIDLEYTKDLFRQMKSLNKKFSCYGNINLLNENEDLLKLSKDAGCNTWCVGFESFSQENLDQSNKKNKASSYQESIKKIHKFGLRIKGLFIFGFDGDTTDTFNFTYKKIKNLNIDFAYFSILTPFPGSRLYTRLKKENRINTEDWSKYTSGFVVYEPKNMTSDELYDKTNELTKNFYSFSTILARSLDFKHPIVLNSASNFLFNSIDKTYVKMRMKEIQ